jgi:Fur family ferric uptake transcriptional regulator
MPPVPEDAIATRLRQVGLRITYHRQVLLAMLHNVHGHATAELLRANVTGPQIPLPTVYAVLGDLVRAGLVKEVRGEDGVLRFDANVARHHHLSCVACGKLQDVPCADVDDSDPCLALQDRHGWAVRSAEVTFRGLCPACTAQTLDAPIVQN